MSHVNAITSAFRGRRGKIALALAAFVSLAMIGFSLFRPGGPLARDAVWARIRDRGVWRVAMDPSFPPFESPDADGRPAGFDVDLVNEICRS